LAGLLQWLLLAVLVVAVLLPLAAILGKAADGDGQFAGLMQISKTLSQPGLLRAINGSLQVAVLSTLLVVPLAYGYAARCAGCNCPCAGCSACWPCCLCWHHPCCPAFHWFTCSAIRLAERMAARRQHLRADRHCAGRGLLHLPACADDSAHRAGGGRCPAV
jgi:hypothetical protein